MAKISILSDQVANQIAAGEVIERPASIVKELIENSLDAGATSIEVEFKKGGANYLRIEDDGCGMSQEDALLSLERHATSKIRSANDLNSLASMGFRGEALPSIASVSKFTIQTREPGSDSGTEILVDGGKLVHCRECGMPPGTRITVSQLFNSVPARRKFLKSVATESAHIVHNTRLYALAHPSVSFALLDDGRTLFRTPSCANLQERVMEIFGKGVVGRLIEVAAEDQDMRLKGLIGAPGHSRSSRHEMLVFVNNRPVDSRTLGYALIESYYGHIPKGRYPVAFLFLELPAAQVDVNVHPAKREIRFRNEANVRGFAVRAILEALKETVEVAAAPVELTFKKRPSAGVGKSSQPISDQGESSLLKTDSIGARAADSPTAPSSVGVVNPAKSAKPDSLNVDSIPQTPASASDSPRALSDSWQFIGWGQGIYALFDTDAGIVVMDVKSSQKRVWYERILASYVDRCVQSQSLLLPIPVELDPVSAAILTDNMEFLETLGLEASPFGRNFFRIVAVPSWLPETDSESYLRDVVELLRKGGVSDNRVSANHEALAKQAANRVVHGFETPTEAELSNVVDALFKSSNPLSDPDGHPTFIELAKSELNRRFHRS